MDMLSRHRLHATRRPNRRVTSVHESALCVLACCLVLGLACCSMGADAGLEGKGAQVDALFSPIAGAEAPGASVIVVRSGQVLHEKGYGLASLEHGVPNTPYTVFRLGSVTKQFTAMAILQLADRGILDLDDTVARYLPDAPHAEEITIRHLLTHTSGLVALGDDPLEFPPGERVNYRNEGYILLGRIIEKVSGSSYEVYLRENIFEPLGMESTGVERPGLVIKHRASGYSSDGKGAYLNTGHGDISASYAAGALYSTVRDMCLWDQALYSEELVRSAALNEAFTPARLNDGAEAIFGFGWMVRTYRGLREVYHGGDIEGFNCAILRFPDQQFCVVVLSNVGMWPPSGLLPNATDLAHAIADTYLSDIMQPVREPVTVALDPAVYDAYVGRYKAPGPPEVVAVMGDTITIIRENGRLYAETRVGKTHLCPESETTFFCEDQREMKVSFVKDDLGRVKGILLDMMGARKIYADRITNE